MLAEIERFSRFLIASHRNPDGDSIGSQLALHRILSALGKSAVMVAVDPVPDQYRFLPDWEEIRQQSHLQPTEAECLFVLDSSSYGRTGLPAWKGPLVNIDHHSDNAMFGTANWAETGASCCCQLIFNLAEILGVSIDPAMAQSLFTGLLTDTGGFRFSNTTTEVFEMSARLMRQGLDAYGVNCHIYNNNSLSKVRIRGKILSEAKLLFEGRVGFIEMDSGLLTQYDAKSEDTEGISDEMMRVAGVEVAIFARYNGNQTKFNLRSAGNVNVGALARHFGGGGHFGAAGCTLEKPKKQACALLFAELESAINALVPQPGKCPVRQTVEADPS